MPEDHDAPSPPRGLRERKKQLTRRTIADAAFSLAIERGLDAVTIDEIAERAFVSPRTVSNYFPSKEAAVVAADADEPDAVVATLAHRPADEPLLDALRAVLAATVRGWTPEHLESLRAKEELIDRFPALLPHRMAQYDALEDTIRCAVAERTHGDADIDTFPRLVAGAAAAAMKTAIRIWVQQGGDGERLAELVEQGFDELGAGLTAED